MHLESSISSIFKTGHQHQSQQPSACPSINSTCAASPGVPQPLSKLKEITLNLFMFLQTFRNPQSCTMSDPEVVQCMTQGECMTRGGLKSHRPPQTKHSKRSVSYSRSLNLAPCDAWRRRRWVVENTTTDQRCRNPTVTLLLNIVCLWSIQQQSKVQGRGEPGEQ